VELESAGIVAVGPDLVEGTDWSFQITLFGTSDITSAKVTVPDAGSTEIPLDCGSCDDGRVDCDFDRDFASLAALLLTYPAGTYQLSINDGERTASLSFDPSDPPGTVTLTSPMNGEMNVSSTPTVEYTSSCSACDLLLFGVVAFFGDISLEFLTDVTSSGSIPYAAWQESQSACDVAPKPPSLPADPYIALGAAFLGSMTTESLDQGSGPAFEFEYTTGGIRGDLVFFAVPEPAGSLPWLAALATLGGLATRRSRSRRRRA
jgi:hypothetical protein